MFKILIFNPFFTYFERGLFYKWQYINYLFALFTANFPFQGFGCYYESK